jgi:hypothetical protein
MGWLGVVSHEKDSGVSVDLSEKDGEGTTRETRMRLCGSVVSCCACVRAGGG